MPTVNVSPRQFSNMQQQIQQSAAEGYGPETCVIHACAAACIDPPKPFEPIDIAVDPALSATDYVRGVYGAPKP